MIEEEVKRITAILESQKTMSLPPERDSKGRFLPGNKIATDVHITGVRSADIRKHRSVINNHIPELLEMLIEEALKNKNIQVAMWLVGKVLPEPKKVMFVDTSWVNEISTLTELKEQSAQTIKETTQGRVSLEEASMLMSTYQDHRGLIEAADIEPLAQEVKKRLEKTRQS